MQRVAVVFFRVAYVFARGPFFSDGAASLCTNGRIHLSTSVPHDQRLNIIRTYQQDMKIDLSTWDGQIEHFLRLDAGFLDGSARFSWQIVRDFVPPARSLDRFVHDAISSRNACRILYHASRIICRHATKSVSGPGYVNGLGKETIDENCGVREVFKDF